MDQPLSYYTQSVFTTDCNSSDPVECKALPARLSGISSEYYGEGPFDYWRKQRSPSTSQLINEYKRIPYACANLNANGVASIRLRFYVKTAKNDRKHRLQNTRKLKHVEIDHLSQKVGLKDFVDVEEVTSHPLLNVLTRVNDTPYMNGCSLSVLTQLYQEICGRAYWYIINDALGRLEQIWLLPSQYLHPKKEQGSRKVVDYYEWMPGTTATVRYKPEEIIPFLMPSLTNPYISGVGPLQASFEANQVSGKLISHENNFLENEARPDAILSPDKEGAIGTDEAKAWEQAWNRKFSRGGGGKILVAEEAMKLTPINFPPRDIARLEIHKWSKLEICNSFGVPLALVEANNINRQTLEAALTQHALQAITPRCKSNAAVLNDQVVSKYDESGRLFFAYDEAVPENEELKVTKAVQLTQAGIITPNESREMFNMPPIAGGDKLQAINSPSNGQNERQGARDNGSAEK